MSSDALSSDAMSSDAMSRDAMSRDRVAGDLAGATLVPVRRGPRTRRRRLTVWVAVLIAAVVAAAVAWTGAAHHRPAPDATARASVESAARAALDALYTVDPDHPDPMRVGAHLTEPLLTSYRTAGADVVLPGAVAASARLSVTIVAIGVSEYHPDRARLLAFIDQRIEAADSAPRTTGDVENSEESQETTIPAEKWLVMSRVNGTWLLGELLPVGDLTR